MRILVVHNDYGKPSGEEAVVESLSIMLSTRGHEVVEFRRRSASILGTGRKIGAFFSGVDSRLSRRAIKALLAQQRPQVVHVHNVYPLISPGALSECRLAGVPVVMTVHNYRLVCPDGRHMVGGRVCERCCKGKEYWCVLRNCEGSLPKSLGYALRNWVARRFRLFQDNVTMYAALTEFQRKRLIDAGFAAERITVIPNMAESNGQAREWQVGEYVAFVGRVSREKGVDHLAAAAREHGDIPFKAAGNHDGMRDLVGRAPVNLDFLGHLNREKLREFYRDSRMVVLPSVCFEGFPMVLAEAMTHGKPVVCSRIGGLPEIVDDGVTGLLCEPGNAEDLGQKIRYLWERPDLCRQMGRAGQEKALREYSPERYYERLMALYRKAIALGPGGPSRNR